ncbi:GNAT family N-acetyltransferase [Loktanella sp. M215]|uniref:GNAT family N-acetyltransferase n=1 Tax=Loktanella sp. M215 TaxID=2675431 RepID=UPI001F4487F4|nr:GNAT family N-acetyltransferase [Loktanella sp. M215]MCF7698613.1 hypothetical protein [Loktanella sp. M215]
MPIEIDHLGSRRFGVVLARTTDAQATPEALNAAARRLDVAMLTTRIDCADHDRIHALEADGHLLMDSLVYWARGLQTTCTVRSAQTAIVVRLATPDDVTAVGQVARAAFRNYVGHFHSDPKLERLSADAAYVEWAETSIRNVTADRPVLVAGLNRQISGFLTLRRNAPDEWEIVLNAVDPAAQGGGIYGHLVSAVIDHARSAVADAAQARLITSTQLNNYTVQRVWSRRDFHVDHAFHTFHKWYPVGQETQVAL